MGITGANVRGALAAALDHTDMMSGPELVWLVPKLEGAKDNIDQAARSTRVVSPPEVTAKRKEAAGHDGAFDANVRAGYMAFNLAELVVGMTDPAKRKLVTVGKGSLFPDGLGITQLTWAGESDEAQLFSERRARPEVQAALVVVKTVVPAIEDLLAAAVTAGTSLGTSMRELAVLEAGRDETPQMFAARSRGMQVLSLLRAAVDEAYPARDKANAVTREKLIGRYRELLELAADKPGDAPVASGDAPAGDAPA